MQKTHLIVGNSEDYHAVAVKWALNQINEDAWIWDGIGPTEDSCISFDPVTLEGGINLGKHSFQFFDSVWYRRVVRFKSNENIAQHSRSFVERELRESHNSLCAMIDGVSNFIVCGSEISKSFSKAWQLNLAKKMGFLVPETLISNNYYVVKDFLSRHERVVVKHFAPHFWSYKKTGGMKILSTTILDDISFLSRDSFELCPNIFQEFINKEYELRVTVIGDNIFAARIDNLEGGAFLDWRLNFGATNFSMSPVILDSEISFVILNYFKTLGLHYGCVDFAVDRSGNIYFLEVNPTGQFLFVEQLIPEFKMLETFAMMLSNQSHERHSPTGRALSTQDFENSEQFRFMKEQSGSLNTSSSFITEIA